MINWKETRVGDIGKVITGKTPKTSIDENYGGDIPFITPSDDMTTKYIFTTNKKLTEMGAQSVKNNIIPPNTICVSCIGSDLGKVVISTETSVTNQQINSIVLNENEYDLDFIYYVMTSLGKVMNHHSKTSTAVPIVNKTQFSDYTFMCPDLITQKKIGGVLASLDDKISNNRSINRNLAEQAATLFQAWFVKFEPYGGSMPDNWSEGNLGQIAELKTRSFSPAKNPDVTLEHYSIPSYDEKHFPVFEIASGVKSNKYVLTPSSVMISKLNPDTKRIWRPLCLTSHAVCSTEFMVYEAINPEHKDYVYSIIDDPMFSAFLCAHTTGSTNSRQRATPSVTLTYPVLIPPDDVINEFCSIVSPMYDLIGANTLENQKLANTRDSLLPKLMSGELNVSGIIS
ncbi:restriction endonuclease subunit S [Pectinatus cerevisiiphilus]|uniref:Type I restriction enzyme S subunit n=1 Tax=Pectinatus cerevisiiphilus TaxID=86956 RepID=A0A4R3K4P0_9FIRM|nr:restriction endonuclease subunit S [Pectinatus cerevisiiphilus]TCS77660.1 type I restriction enzyme S subunit [Pectinatus cerevisiiphilus]